MDRSTDEEVVAVAKHEASPKQEQGFGIDVKQRQSQVHRRGGRKACSGRPTNSRCRGVHSVSWEAEGGGGSWQQRRPEGGRREVHIGIQKS